jgi:hypothetical protein
MEKNTTVKEQTHNLEGRWKRERESITVRWPAGFALSSF